jgi:hypothetical protein
MRSRPRMRSCEMLGSETVTFRLVRDGTCPPRQLQTLDADTKFDDDEPCAKTAHSTKRSHTSGIYHANAKVRRLADTAAELEIKQSSIHEVQAQIGCKKHHYVCSATRNLALVVAAIAPKHVDICLNAPLRSIPERTYPSTSSPHAARTRATTDTGSRSSEGFPGSNQPTAPDSQ